MNTWSIVNMCAEQENLHPLYQKFLEEIEDCAEDCLGDWEMKFLEQRPDVLERLYKLEERMNTFMRKSDWKGLLSITPKWREAHNWIRSQTRKMFGNDIKCEVAEKRVTLKDGKKI